MRDSLQVWDLMSARLIETINPRNRPATLNGEFLYVVQYFDGDPYGELVLAGGSVIGAVEMINLKEKEVCDSSIAPEIYICMIWYKDKKEKYLVVYVQLNELTYQ